MKNTKKTTVKTAKKTKAAEQPALSFAPIKAAATVKPATVKATAAKQPAVTTVKAKIDVGFGNTLFVRGQGAGLSWDRGTPLVCEDGQTWTWTAPATDRLTFKLLLNDSVWAQGEDVVADAGKQVVVSPRF